MDALKINVFYTQENWISNKVKTKVLNFFLKEISRFENLPVVKGLLTSDFFLNKDYSISLKIELILIRHRQLVRY